jgi:Tfp pilus assembly protein PilX
MPEMHMPRPLPCRRQRERGSALLLAVMLVLILGVVGLAVVQRGAGEGEAVSAKRHHDQAITCADAARELLMSQFSAYGTSPTQMTLNSAVGDHTLSTGHYDNINVTSVLAATGSSQAAFGVSDVSNRIARVGLGGQVYRMTVVCSAPPANGAATNRQSEVEYLVRFGL